MATKVDKRQERKRKNAEALGIDLNDEAKAESNQKGLFKNKSGGKFTWTLFFIEILLLLFIFSFNK